MTRFIITKKLAAVAAGVLGGGLMVAARKRQTAR